MLLTFNSCSNGYTTLGLDVNNFQAQSLLQPLGTLGGGDPTICNAFMLRVLHLSVSEKIKLVRRKSSSLKCYEYQSYVQFLMSCPL